MCIQCVSWHRFGVLHPRLLFGSTDLFQKALVEIGIMTSDSRAHALGVGECFVL